MEKKQTVPAELLEEAFELNMLLEEAKLGGVDDDLRGQLIATRDALTARMEASRGAACGVAAMGRGRRRGHGDDGGRAEPAQLFAQSFAGHHEVLGYVV